MTLSERIVQIARSYIGQEETANNSGFKSSWFRDKLVAMGWLKFQSWCAYTGKSIWYDAFKELDPVGAKLVLKYANGSVLQTYNNFARSKEFHVQVSPVPGALVMFREGNKTTGHEGVVTTLVTGGFNFISGNTSKAGSREGTTVLEKYRAFNTPYQPNGLNLIGFVNCIRIS